MTSPQSSMSVVDGRGNLGDRLGRRRDQGRRIPGEVNLPHALLPLVVRRPDHGREAARRLHPGNRPGPGLERGDHRGDMYRAAPPVADPAYDRPVVAKHDVLPRRLPVPARRSPRPFVHGLDGPVIAAAEPSPDAPTAISDAWARVPSLFDVHAADPRRGLHVRRCVLSSDPRRPRGTRRPRRRQPTAARARERDGNRRCRRPGRCPAYQISRDHAAARSAAGDGGAAVRPPQGYRGERDRCCSAGCDDEGVPGSLSR